jgi:uncharacterized protein involved in response to NO
MARSLLFPPDSSRAHDSASLPLLAKGFRPFFLLAGVFAALFIPLWLFRLRGVAQAPTYLDPTTLHAHEMVFGFVVAVLAGFLLTAVGNWTQRETAVGMPLLALAGTWLAGRAAMFFSDALPRGLTAAVELAFLPALIVTLARPLLAARSRRNLVMLAILGALFAADVVAHLAANGLLPLATARRACLVAIDVILLVISIMAGRVFPMFTKNATGAATIRSVAWLDAAAIGGMAIATLLDTGWPEAQVTAFAFGVTGVLTAARALHWGAHHSFRQPLLWVLHLGYGWLCLGLSFRALELFGVHGLRVLALHALTLGAIGGSTLGMMARVALGHTGRLLTAPRAMAWAFGAMNAATAARVFGPLLLPQRYFAVLSAAGLLWVLAFTIFVASYAPVLLRPRLDGRPG